MSSIFFAYVTSLKYVIIYKMHDLLVLYQFLKTFYQELAVKSPYQASIGGMRPRLVELQAEESPMRKIRAEKLGGN